jgi:hypothetical protein
MILDSGRKKVTLRGMTAAISAAIVLATLSGVSSIAAVPNTAPNVTFTASGTFASPPVSGTDTLKLAGEPFLINIVASAASVPIKHGRNWAIISPLKMTGTVHSGLLGSNPVNIASTGASIFQAVGPSYDIFETAFPIKVVGISLTVNAYFILPAGTITTQLIHPFPAVALDPGNTTVTYSDGTNTTTLAIQSGSMDAQVSSGGEGQTTATPHSEGTESTRSRAEWPVALAGSSRRPPGDLELE